MNKIFSPILTGILRTLAAFSLLLIFTTADAGAVKNEWKPIETSLARDTAAVTKDTRTTRALIAQEKKSLHALLTSVQASITEEKTRLAAQKKQFETLLAKEGKMRSELEEQQEDIKTLETVVRASAKDADTMIHDSLISPAFPDRRQTLSPILDAAHFPALNDIQNLVSLFLQEAEETGNITRYQKTIVGPEGKEIPADILRVGGFTALYHLTDGRAGYLRAEKDGNRWIAVPGSPGSSITNRIKDAFAGKTDDLPLDISRGAALQGIGQQKDTAEWLRSGGMLVWPILFVGIIALLVSLERMLVLCRLKRSSDGDMQNILEFVRKKDWDACKNFCSTLGRTPAFRVIQRTLEAAGARKEVMEATLDEAILREIPPMERFLATLNILAAIAPLLGLLGTVTGMISTFQIITLYGTGDPRMMSGGISEALITTQLGLGVAIPIMLIHHFLQRRVENLIGDMEEKGTAFTAAILGSHEDA